MTAAAAVAPLETWDGDVEGVLLGDEAELLRELLAVVDATRDKSIKLTKSGIPPKPLWSAVNDRLIWQDPRSILYDWDEVDQVRFVYALGMALGLVHPDEERVLVVGPGADQFYLAGRTRRAEMLLRAYAGIDEWDERCDARNMQGHRQNFGQTFRRDFRVGAPEVRGALLDGLRGAPEQGWVLAETLALRVSLEAPDILLCEDDEPIAPIEDVSDPEIRRLVDYWLFQVARLGLVDLARIVGAGELDGERVFRVTALGARLLGCRAWDADAEELAAVEALRPYVIQPNNDIVLYRHEADVGDEYLLHRIAEDAGVPDWEQPVATYRVTRGALNAAIEGGLDPRIVREHVLERCRAEAPPTFRTLLADAERGAGDVRVVPGFTVVELAPGSEALAAELQAAGLRVARGLALVPWSRWGEFVALAGAEPSESFRYPAEEPLLIFDGDTLELAYLAKPLAARDLLDELGVDGDAGAAVDDAALARIAPLGWSPRAVAEALEPLAESMPRRLKNELK